MKPPIYLRHILAAIGASMIAVSYAQADTFTFTLPNGAVTGSGNWSSDPKWNAVPVSAADTILNFNMALTGNTQTQTWNEINDIATGNPNSAFQLNRMNLNASPSAGIGSQIAALTISGNPLHFVTTGTTTPVVNLAANRSNGQPVNFIISAPVVLGNNTSFIGNGTASFTISGAISGAGTLTKSGTSTLTLSNISLPSAMTVDGGTLILTGNSNPASNSMTVNTGGILRIGNNTATQLNSGNYAGNISTGTGGTLQLWSTSAQTFSGIISGSGGINKAYGGALTLSGPNTYTGRTSFLPQTTAGFTVNVSSFNSVVGGTASSSLGAPTTVANGTIDLGSGSAQAGVNLTYVSTATGETTDRVINIGFNGTSSQTITANNSTGVLRFTSAFTSNAVAQSGRLILAGTGAGQIDQGLPQLATGGLEKQGTGTWTLGGSGNFTGATIINGGTLSLSSATALQNSAFNTASVLGSASAGLQIATTTLTLGGLTGSNAFSTRFKTGGGYTGLTMLTLNPGTGASHSYSGDIGNGNGNLALIKTGVGTQTLSGTNTYQGGTTVNQGTLTMAATGTLGATTGTLSMNNTNTALPGTNAILNLATGADTTVGSLSGTIATPTSGTNTATINTQTGRTFTVNQTANATYQGVIAGAGAFTLGSSSTHTLTLTGTNTYTGDTLVNAGTLTVNGSLASSSVVVADGASLGGSGVMANATLSGAGSINPGNSPGVLTAAATDPTGGLSYNFEFTAANTLPTWDQASASVNDVLRLTDGTDPFTANLTSFNLVSIYLNVGSVTAGNVFTGGFYTDKNAAFLDAISSATFQYFIASMGGDVTYNGIDYVAYTGLTFNVATIAQTADFGSGDVDGFVTQFTAIPEPTTALLGGVGLLFLLRRKR